jgi:autotransporter-associated beta strand protein
LLNTKNELTRKFMKNLLLSPMKKLAPAALAVSLLATCASHATPVYWRGTNGVSQTTNWSDTLNWSLQGAITTSTPANNAANFNGNTAMTASGLVTVNVDGAYGSPGSGLAQSYGAFFTTTNGDHTVFIQPGITWAIQATTGTQGIGISVGPQATNNNNINNANTVSTGATYTNYTTITGAGGTLFANLGANTGGVRVEAASTSVNNHYSILDMSGLGTYIMTNNGGLGNHCSFYVVNGGQNSQGLAYLALTNVITLNDAFQVGNLGSSSNSLPIGVYLGQSNYITTGANNNNFIVGYTGCTNAFMVFNPALLRGAAMPTAYISGTSSNQNVLIGSAAGGKVPGYAVCDFTGGEVTWIGNNMALGVSGIALSNTAANGVLTFVNGTVGFNTILVGDESVAAGAPGVGTINIGSNATLQANTSITLGACAGAVTAGTAGTINISSNGTLLAGIVTNGGGVGTVNMTNGNWGVSLLSTNVTNMILTAFNGGGTTNIINITSITPALGGSPPLRFHLLAAASLNGVSTLGLGPLPASDNPGLPYAGYLDTTTTPGLVDFVLTAAPPSVRSLTWTGMNAGSPDGNWDVDNSYNWQTNGGATFFNQYDVVTFKDIASLAQTNVSLTTTITPFSLTVSNNASLYTLGLGSDSGSISGSTGLLKQGAGTLILDNGVANTFTGAITISGGILQVGNNDTSGSLPAGPITDNAVLAYARADNISVGNIISGSGSVVSAGGGTLQLAMANTFTGSAIATNNSTLQGGVAGAFGATNGTNIIASGSTFDPNGSPTLRAVTVSGAGVNGVGAIVNSGGPIYDSSASTTPAITLTGDTTFSYPMRWDLGSPNGAPFPLSTGGHAYNLTLNGTGNNSYFEWREVQADAKLANITVTAGYFGITGASTLGSTNASLNILAYASTKFYANDGFNVTINKPVVLNDEGTIYSETGTNVIAGGLVLTNSGGNQNCIIDVYSASLTVAGPLSGNGILLMQAGTGPLIINGNASAFTGGVLAYTGTLTLNGTIGSGITNTPPAILDGTGVANGYVDVSGTFVPGGSNVVGTFTAAAGLALESSCTPVINLTATTAEGGAHNSLIAVTGDLTVNGNTVMINPIGTLVNGTYTLMTYTGSLLGSFGGAQTVASSTYTLTLNTNTPGLVQLVVSGAPAPAAFAGPIPVAGTNLTLAGTGGTISGTYRVYSSTNLATPLANWTLVGTGSFDGAGNFTFPAGINTNDAAQFFILEEP